MKKLNYLLFALVLLVACKKQDEQKEKKEIVDNFFSVQFFVKADKQDDFTVYWSEDNTNVFDGARAIWGGVKGGGIDEEITIKLPEQIIPTNIRVDFGIKPDKENVVINSLKLNYYGNSFEIKGSDFLKYFVERPEIKTTVDLQKNTITLSKTPELKDGYYYYPKSELLEVIKKMTTEKKE
jgi:hypothetical protein